ncbi:hypothetical protein A3J43_02200 [Candidatus Uhrbacteria bacterium RIFCSPHIGHO2_12_FULL_54_23]|uniref:Ribonuclease VapC n=2 Tax=Candidatus Uhriibacteriota TaxID=1752732 RepID=A0A1F7UM73_9BACT|nr:MAG: hypothetical protein A3J43_02200 [Candidatus Uhrbacteria bacterium RIFCSPHIGHO2_12_FULL_54_23]OGL90304.1 MAG: hypothetical protein A3J36_01980 [Candidatus Uhrbacteria bacterium RIFCSPLOWO2_02_FULL_54_37]
MGVTSPTLFSTGERVYLDSAVFIYYVENRVPYADALKPFFEAIEHERVDAYTSTVTVAEILTVPKREKKNALVKAFRTFLTEFVTVVPLDFEIADAAATLRADHPTLHIPDTFHLATALITRCDRILTNDQQLAALSATFGMPVSLVSQAS